MKKFICSIVLSLLVVVGSAQNFKSTRIGLVDDNGSYELSIPISTIGVDVIVEMESITPGIYARYAQKYLALRTPLIEKTTYRIVDASINLLEPNSKSQSEILSITSPLVEYGVLPVDQLSSTVLPIEDAARQAAEAIFTIRRQRRELVSGEAGENYFGAGLASAVAALDATEAEYLKLFTAKRTVIQTIKHFSLTPVEGTTQYIIARFSDDAGLLSANDLSGVPVYLQTQVAHTLDTSAIEAGPKASNFIWFRVAAPTNCTLYNDSQEITSTILPIYEFGKSIKVEVPKR